MTGLYARADCRQHLVESCRLLYFFAVQQLHDSRFQIKARLALYVQDALPDFRQQDITEFGGDDRRLSTFWIQDIVDAYAADIIILLLIAALAPPL